MSFSPLSGLNGSVVARVLLLANHVIASEPAAVQKLRPHAGRHLELRLGKLPTLPLLGSVAAWLPSRLRLCITPAGLLELVESGSGASTATTPSARTADDTEPALALYIDLPSPQDALRMAWRRQAPEVRIEGDAALAEAMSWITKNLRWDIEDDLARWLGTPPTQLLKELGKQVTQALSRWRSSV